MFLRPSPHSIFLFFLQLILLSLSPTVCPTPVGLMPYDALVQRSNSTQDISQPSTIITVSQINTSMGPATETCNITLTPILSNGQPKVQEVKQCAIVLDGSGGSVSAGTNGSSGGSTSTSSSSSMSSSQTQSGTSTCSSSTSSISSTATPSGSAGPIPAVKVNGASTVPAAAPPPPSSSSFMSSSQTQLGTSSTANPSGSAGPIPAVKVNGASTVPAATPSPPSSSSSMSSSQTQLGTSSTANPSGSAGPIPAVKVNGVSTVPAATPSPTLSSPGSSSPSGVPVAAAAAASSLTSPSTAASATQAAAFTIPGRKLSILPIGLGVFAGVSVIALIVVGLVTYERTKYRKAFRQRKLAEAGQSMGYGGMADRT